MSSLAMNWGEMRLHFQHSTSIFLLVNSIILTIILLALKVEQPKPARKPRDRLLLVRKINGHDPALLSSSSDDCKSDVFTNGDLMNSTSNASLDDDFVSWRRWPRAPEVRRSAAVCHGEAAADKVSHDRYHTTQRKEESIATAAYEIPHHDHSNSSKGIIIPVEAGCCKLETGSCEVNECNHELEESELVNGGKERGLIVIGDGKVDDLLSAKSDVRENGGGTKTKFPPPGTTTSSAGSANENTMEKIWTKIMQDKQNLLQVGRPRDEDLRERVQNLEVGDGDEVAVDERAAFGEVGDGRMGSNKEEVESGVRRRTSVGRSTMNSKRRNSKRRNNWKKTKMEMEEMEMTSEELRRRAEDFIARFYAQRRQSQKTKRRK